MTRRKSQPLRVELLEDRTTPAFFTWTGTGGDNLWANAANWDQNGALPTLDDDVSIFSASAPILIQDGAAAVGSLSDMSAGGLVLKDSLTIGMSATMMNRLEVDVGGSLTADAGQFGMGAGLSINNLDLAGQIHLAGASQLMLAGDANLHGGATIDGDGVASLGFGSLSVADSAIIQNFNLSGGNVQGPGYLTITGTMNFTGGTLAGPNTTVGMPPYDAPGTLDIAPGAVLNFAGAYSSPVIDSWTINDNGTINWTQGDVNNYDSTVNVGAGFAFNISASGATWRDSLGDGGSTINNAGTLTKTGGMTGMAMSIDAALNSTSTLEVQSGSMSLKGGGSFAGTLDIQANAQLVLVDKVFMAANFVQAANQPQGPLIIDGTTSPLVNLIIGVAPSLGFPSVTLNRVELRTGGEISGPGTLVIAGQSRWSGGTMSGSGRTEITGTLTVDYAGSNGFVFQEGRTIQNLGTVNVQGLPNANGSTWIVGDGAELDNDGQFTINTLQNQGRVAVVGAGAGSLINRSQITVSGAGRAMIAMPAVDGGLFAQNQGAILVDNGTLALRGIFENYGGYLQANMLGTVEFGLGDFTFDTGINDGPPDMMRGEGSFVVDNSGAVIVVPQFSAVTATNFYLRQGRLEGLGTFEARYFYWSGGTMSDQGLTLVGSGGSLIIGGDVTIDGRTITINAQGKLTWEYWELSRTIAMQNSSTINISGGRFETENVTGRISTDDTPNRILVADGGVLERKYTEVGGTIYIDASVENNGGSTDFQGDTTFRRYSQTLAASVSQFAGGTYRFVNGDSLRIYGGTFRLSGGAIENQQVTTHVFSDAYIECSGTISVLDTSNCWITLTGALGVGRFDIADATITWLQGFNLQITLGWSKTGASLIYGGGGVAQFGAFLLALND